MCVPIPACGVYTSWQVALALSAASWHVSSPKAPVRLVLNVTVPIGVVPGPRPVSLTVTMQLVACPITTPAESNAPTSSYVWEVAWLRWPQTPARARRTRPMPAWPDTRLTRFEPGSRWLHDAAHARPSPPHPHLCRSDKASRLTTNAPKQGGHPAGECYSATASCQRGEDGVTSVHGVRHAPADSPGAELVAEGVLHPECSKNLQPESSPLLGLVAPPAGSTGRAPGACSKANRRLATRTLLLSRAAFARFSQV